MEPNMSNASQSRRGRCAVCSNDATNSCAGRIDAPAYGNGQPQRTFYCNTQCQKADWSGHKAECKALQARKSLFRAATVLDATIGVLDAKGKKGFVRLAAFWAQLVKGNSHSRD